MPKRKRSYEKGPGWSASMRKPPFKHERGSSLLAQYREASRCSMNLATIVVAHSICLLGFPSLMARSTEPAAAASVLSISKPLFNRKSFPKRYDGASTRWSSSWIMEPRTHLNSSKAGFASKNADAQGNSTFRCSGYLPMHPGLIRSKFGSVCFSANICSRITFSAPMPSKPLSTSSLPITTRLPNRSTGPIRLHP